MISPCMLERLEKTADAIEIQRDPFSAEWLPQNNITVQESLDLPERIGRILRDHRLSHKEEGNR